MRTFNLFWSPEGKLIATVQARTMRAANPQGTIPVSSVPWGDLRNGGLLMRIALLFVAVFVLACLVVSGSLPIVVRAAVSLP
jgi:hypothetical protein